MSTSHYIHTKECTHCPGFRLMYAIYISVRSVSEVCSKVLHSVQVYAKQHFAMVNCVVYLLTINAKIHYYIGTRSLVVLQQQIRRQLAASLALFESRSKWAQCSFSLSSLCE